MQARLRRTSPSSRCGCARTPSGGARSSTGAACGNQARLRQLRHETGPGAVRIRADLAAPQAEPDKGLGDPSPVDGAGIGQPGQPPKQPDEGAVEQMGTPDCPVTAVFLSTLAGPEKAGCQIPQGTYGASRLTRWRVMGDLPGGAATATITEQFTAIHDPYSMIDTIQKGVYTTANGLFDDCYSLAAKRPLPADFVLKVQQNHMLGQRVISNNEIIFYPDRVSFCSHHRMPQSCDFSARCSL